VADTKISALPVASALDGTEAVPVVQSGSTVRTTTQHIADLVPAPTAAAVSIVDAGSYFTGTTVEAALQELGGTPPGSAAWGAIGGDIEDQTDLQDALATKVDASAFIDWIAVACSDMTTAITTGTRKAYVRVRENGTLVGVAGSLATAQTSGGTKFTVDIKKNGASVLSTLMTFDNAEKTTSSAATPAVISTSSVTVDDEFAFDVTALGAGDAAGLIVYLGILRS
jgi:hypothetical protein